MACLRNANRTDTPCMQCLSCVTDWNESKELEKQISFTKEHIIRLYRWLGSVNEPDNIAAIKKHLHLHVGAFKCWMIRKQERENGYTDRTPHDISQLPDDFGCSTEVESPKELARLIGVDAADLCSRHEGQPGSTWDEGAELRKMRAAVWPMMMYYADLAVIARTRCTDEELNLARLHPKNPKKPKNPKP